MKQKKIEWREGQKELEWRIARQHLILNGEITVNGTKLKRSNQHQPIGYVDQETRSEHHLEHSFIVVDNQILVMAGKGQVLGQNEFNKTKLAEDESGNLYTVKIQFTPLSNYFSGQENSIAVDVGFSSKQIDRVDMPDKAYSVSKYLGMPLDNYIRTCSLTEDERYNLDIKISLLIHELHTGKLSASETKYTHLDIKPDNIVIDTHGNPHLIDFGLAKISSTTPPQSAGSPLYLPENLLISGPSYDVVALLKTLYLPEKIRIFGIERDRTDRYSWLFSDEMVKENRALTSLLDTSQISSEATMSALDVAKKLTIIRCGLNESSSIQINFENIGAINALCTDGVPVKQEFLRPEIIDVVHLLHTSQIKLKEEYLTSSGIEYVHFLKSIAQPTYAYPSEKSFVEALLYTKQDTILQEAIDSVWDAVQTKAMNERTVASAIKPQSGRFLNPDLLNTLNNELGTLEKAAESLGLGHVPMIQNVKLFRGLVILAKRLNNPNVDPMLAAVEGGVSVFGQNKAGITKIVTKTSDVIEGAVSHQSTQDPLENIICGTVGTATQISIDLGFAAGFALYKIPAIAGSMYKVAAVRATCAASYGSFSQSFTSDVANLGGDLAEQTCHFAFKTERERQHDEHSQILPPDMLHVGMPVDLNQASVLGKKMGEAIQALKKTIFDGGQSIGDLIFSEAHATEHSEEVPVINSIGDALRAMQPQNKSKPGVTLEQYEDVAAQFHLATSQLCTLVPSTNGYHPAYDMTKISRKKSVAQISTKQSTSLQPKSDLSASTPCADVVKKSCHTAFANNRKFRANNPIPEINGMNDALFALNPTDPRNSGKKPKRVSIHPKPINFRELFTNGVNQLKEVAPTMVDPNSDMTKTLRALEPSNPVDDERFKYDRKKYVWPKIKSKYEREIQDSHADKTVEGYQHLPQLSCIKDRSKHRFVTPNYVSKDKMEKESGDFLYVISEKGKLMLAKQESLSMNDSGRYLPASHMDLARGKKVIGAGMLHVREGKVVRIDNQTPDYEPVDLQSNDLKSATEQVFQMNGFTDAQDKFIYIERCKSSNTTRRMQESAAHNSDVQASLEKNEKSLFSPSFFSSQRTYNEEISSLVSSSAVFSQPSRSVSSNLASVDFAAHKANFNNIISKGVSVKRTSQQYTPPNFFNRSNSSTMQGTSSGVSTFNVSKTHFDSHSTKSENASGSSAYSCPIVEGPSLSIGIHRKDGSIDWGCPMSLKN